MSESQYQHIQHTFAPVYNESSKILILGSFPSVKSREQGFYYGHKQNRFWKVLSHILSCPEPLTIEEKKHMLLSHHVAIWDVIASCDIIGSSDSSIKNVIPADIGHIVKNSEIKHIYSNGKTSERLYRKYIEPQLHIPTTALPSTSPANAAYSLECLQQIWKDAIILS